MVINFNLIPYDPESYKIYADFQEEQGFLLTNAIRNKILPFDIENFNNKFKNNDINGSGNGNGCGWGCGPSSGFGFGDGYGA